MKEHLLNIGGYLLTIISSVGNLANIVAWLNENKIIFNIGFLFLISFATLIYWIIRGYGKYRKDKLDCEIKQIELLNKQIEVEERKLEHEIKKQQLK